MCEVTPYMVSVATKCGTVYQLYTTVFRGIFSYIPQHGTFDLNHKCSIYIYIYVYIKWYSGTI